MDFDFDKFRTDNSHVKESIHDNKSNEINPFDFEFNAEDVVNREEEITDPFAEDFNESKINKKPNKKAFITEADLEQILNYKDSDRSERLFESKINENAFSSKVQPDNLHQHFNDFMIMPKISGLNNKIPNSMRLPADYVVQRGEKIEIANDPSLDKSKDNPASVIVNRDQYGEVESIEVLCNCGERTYIKFDFAEENEKFDLTEIYNKEITSPQEFDMKKLREKPKIAKANIEDIFTSEDMSNLTDDRKDSNKSSELEDFENLLDSNFN